jgi:hypothetical protein
VTRVEDEVDELIVVVFKFDVEFLTEEELDDVGDEFDDIVVVTFRFDVEVLIPEDVGEILPRGEIGGDIPLREVMTFELEVRKLIGVFVELLLLLLLLLFLIGSSIGKYSSKVIVIVSHSSKSNPSSSLEANKLYTNSLMK